MRLVIRAADARRARALQDALAAAEIGAVALSGAAALGPASQGEDVTLIDADDPACAVFAKAARRAAANTLALVGATARQPSAEALFDAWLPLAGEPAPRLNDALDIVIRDGILRAEARLRRRTAAALGAPPAPRRPPAKPIAALFVGPPHPAFLAIEHAWRGLGGVVSATFTSFSAFDELQDRRADAVLLNSIGDPAAAAALAAAMRRNAQLHHVPILSLAPAAAPPDPALDRADHLILREGEDRAAVLAWLFEHARRARERLALFRILKAIPEPQSPWSAPSFAAHLETLASHHHAGGRPLSLAALRFAARGQADDASWRAGLAELGGLAARLIRHVDCMTADGEGFLFAFPCTDQHGARATIARISSVWSHTAFVADRAFGPRRHERHVVELAPGESGAGLLARARRGAG